MNEFMRRNVVRDFAQARFDLHKQSLVFNQPLVTRWGLNPLEHPDFVAMMTMAGMTDEHRAKLEGVRQEAQAKAVLEGTRFFELAKVADQAEKDLLERLFPNLGGRDMKLHYQPLDVFIYLKPLLILSAAFCEEDATLMFETIGQVNDRLYQFVVYQDAHNETDVFDDLVPYGIPPHAQREDLDTVMKDRYRLQVQRVLKAPIDGHTSMRTRAVAWNGQYPGLARSPLQPLMQWHGYLHHGLLVGNAAELQPAFTSGFSPYPGQPPMYGGYGGTPTFQSRFAGQASSAFEDGPQHPSDESID